VVNRWLPPAAAGLWIVLGLLAGLIWFGAFRAGVRADPFALWTAGSMAMAVAIVATRGGSSSRVASLILAVVSAAGSALLLSSSIAFVAAMALILSVAIAVFSSMPWRPTVRAVE
jgi:hypothetical protein